MKTIFIVIGVIILAVAMLTVFVAADAHMNTDEDEKRDE